MPRRKARGYGRGRIEPADGRYRARITSAGVRHDRTFDRYAEAEQWLDDICDGIETAADIRLGEWLDLWARQYAPKGRSPSTMDNRAWCLRKLAPLASVQLRKLGPDHIAGLLADLAAEGLSKSSVGRVRSVLSSSLKVAIAQRRVTFNACDTVQLPDEATPKRARRSLSRDECDRVLDVVRDTDDEVAIVLGLRLGLRPGEICGLRWADVETERRLLSITQARRAHRTGMTMTKPKTAASIRKIGLPDDVAAMLTAHRTRQKRQRLAARRWHESGLVVTSDVGTPVDPSNLRRTVERVCIDARVEPITPHEMRHTAITLLREAGAPLGALRQLVGHADLRMLSRDYYHDTLDVADAAVEYDDYDATRSEVR